MKAKAYAQSEQSSRKSCAADSDNCGIQERQPDVYPMSSDKGPDNIFKRKFVEMGPAAAEIQKERRYGTCRLYGGKLRPRPRSADKGT